MHDLFSIYLSWRRSHEKRKRIVLYFGYFFIYIILYYFYFILYSFAIIFLRNIFLYEFSMSKLFHSHPLTQFNFKTFQAPEIFFYLFFFNHFQILCIEWLLAMENIYSVVLLMSTILHEYSYEIPKSEWKWCWGLNGRQYTMFRSMR